jgi:hypothetical protein
MDNNGKKQFEVGIYDGFLKGFVVCVFTDNHTKFQLIELSVEAQTTKAEYFNKKREDKTINDFAFPLFIKIPRLYQAINSTEPYFIFLNYQVLNFFLSLLI